jgi:polysaccharide chain length determinant protein (PEP-CTERM system associated)
MNLDISYYVSVFLRRIYVMIIVAFGMTAAATYVALELPPTYRSEARLLVEAPQIPTSLAESTVQVETSEQLQIIEQRLMTRENLLEIARQFDAFPGIEGMSADAIVAEMRQNTSITHSSGRTEATLMSVGFTSANGNKAAGVANEYVTRILDSNRELRTRLAEQTMDFFEQEVERLSGELSSRSEKIVAFKKQNADALPTSLEFRQDRRTALQERLNQLERELVLLDDQEKRLKQVFESGGAFTREEQLSPDARQLAQLNADLESALAVYSPTNPRVRMLEAQIQQVRQRISTAGPDEDGAEVEQDPQRAVLDLQLAEIDSRRQHLLDQRSFIEKEVEDLTESIARTPEITVAVDSLERDYGNIQEQYNQAAARLATAATGERIELLSKGERITVIEQATVPNRPTSPNRPLIAGAGALVGVGLGSALIFLLEFLNQSIRRPVDLERQLGVTPIATLPYIRTRREVVWKRLVLIALIALVVVGGPAVIYAIHTYVMPIDLIIDRVLSRISG